MNPREPRKNGVSLSSSPLQRDGEGPTSAPRGTAKQLGSEDLLKGNRRIEILHNGERYVLSLTRLGKLILTK